MASRSLLIHLDKAIRNDVRKEPTESLAWGYVVTVQSILW